MMTPIFLNQPTAQCFNPNQDQLTEHEQLQALASSPSYQLHLGQGLTMSDQSPASDQLEVSKNMFFDGESPSYGARVTSTNNYGSSHSNELFIFKQREDQEPSNINGCRGVAADNGSSLRWMSSKMRMMRRMISSNGRKTDPKSGSRISSGTANLDQGPQFNINNDVSYSNNVIRVCSDCNTTKTPLWRSGPQGPKSLCNACGIRQRKARKAAMEAAATAATDNSCEASSSTSAKTPTKLMTNKVKNKSRATSNTCVSQQSNKKQTPCNKQQPNPLADSDHNNSSTSSSSRRQLLFEDFAVNLLSKNASFHRMFPQDEEEGALLLMALSYGLIHN